MTKRIFRSFILIGVLSILVTITLIMSILYPYFAGEQIQQLREKSVLVAQGVTNEGLAYFDGMADMKSRITWISIDGAVLYDNESNAATMENHLEREEVKEAFSTGIGEATRYSKTMMTRMDYVARRLADNTVIRLSRDQYSVPTILLSMLQPILVCIAIAIALSLFLAFRLTRRVVLPLNNLNLDDPMANKNLDELQPLFERLDLGQRELDNRTEQLRRRKIEFETATDGMQEGLVLLDEKGSLLSINASASRLLNISKYSVGKDILLMNSSREMQELLGRCFEGRYAETVLQFSGIPHKISASPVISDSNVTGAAILIREITDREKAEQQRREFTANVSHELKTPLQTITGCAELMKSGMVRAEDQKSFAENIYAQSMRMTALVEDIIHLAKLDEGAEKMQREEVDLTAIALSEISLLQSDAERAGVTISCTAEHIRIHCVRSLAISIIHNLIDNAIKYNKPNGTINVVIRETDPSVQLEIRDTGIGIPRESYDRIFERFYRVDKSRSREAGGTGLGLSIVKHAVRLLNGRIDLESEIGVGSKFTVTLFKS